MRKKDKTSEPSTLLEMLLLTGQIETYSKVQIATAKRMYCRLNRPIRQIADHIRVDEEVVEHWIRIFEWDEEKERLEFKKYREIAEMAAKRGIDINSKADKILGNIEELVKEMIDLHHKAKRTNDPKMIEAHCLEPKDLKMLADTIKISNSQRRTIRGEPGKITSGTIEVSGNAGIMQRVGLALSATVAREEPKLLEDIKEATFFEVPDEPETTRNESRHESNNDDDEWFKD